MKEEKGHDQSHKHVDPERRKKFEEFINSKEEVDRERSVDTNIKEQATFIKIEDSSNKLVRPILIATFILMIILLASCLAIVCLAASGVWSLPPVAYVPIFGFMGGVVWLWRQIVSHFFRNRKMD